MDVFAASQYARAEWQCHYVLHTKKVDLELMIHRKPQKINLCDDLFIFHRISCWMKVANTQDEMYYNFMCSSVVLGLHIVRMFWTKSVGR
jgi:hypothetical protein